MFFEITVSIVITLIFTYIIDELLQPKTSLPRVGTDPGPLNVLKWWARWKWLKRGHEDVIQTYGQVRGPLVVRNRSTSSRLIVVVKNNGKNYVVQTMLGDTVILQPEFLGELNMLPESKMSSTAALVDSVFGQYTGVDHLLKDHLTTDICRGSFTRHLGKAPDIHILGRSPSVLTAQVLFCLSWRRNFGLL